MNINFAYLKIKKPQAWHHGVEAPATMPCSLPGRASDVLAPLFALGAALGRLVGELMVLFGSAEVLEHASSAPQSHLTMQSQAAAYAIAGAAAVTCGATRGISTAVVVLELTRQWNHAVPVLIAVLAGAFSL